MSFLVQPGVFNQKLTADEKIERRRQDGITRVKLPPQIFRCSKDTISLIKGAVNDLRVGSIDEALNEFTIDGGLSLEVIQKFNTASGDQALTQFLNDVYQLQVETYESNQKAAKDSITAAERSMKERGEILSMVEDALRSKQRDKALLAGSKRPGGVFLKDDVSSWKFLNHEDAQQSRENLQKIAIDKGKVAKKIDSEIIGLTEEMRPVADEIESLKTRLNEDLSEPEFKDLKLSIDFRQHKINRIESQIASLTSDKNRAESQIAAIENELTILNLCIDRHALLRERENWTKRKERTAERINRVLSDRNGMIQLRENLNTRWHELTGDKEPLCPELCLLADSEFYVL